MAFSSVRRLRPFLIALVLCGSLVANAELRVQNYDRKVNLQAHYATITENIRIKNSGKNPESKFVVCHLDRLTSHAASFKINQGDAELKVEPATFDGTPGGVSCRSATLQAPIAAGDVAALKVQGIYTKVLTPFPARISQADPQLVLFEDNLYAISPYQVSAQTTEFDLPTGRVESYTKENPVSHNGKSIKYGRYDSIKPFSISGLRVHFEHDRPFAEATYLVKEIEVSHWGNIYVEESYELRNGGSLHQGQFSRLKYAHSQQGRGNSFREMRARLPAPAHSLYYKDIIGNISSSRVRKSITETTVDFELRYPLMGGWKVDFLLGYSLPLKGFLFQLPSQKRKLVINFSSSIDGVAVDDLTVKVVLPEGSTAIKPHLPFPVEQSLDTKFTYLDTTGRPVLVLKKLNTVPLHNVALEVEYAFNPLSMLREPLLLITAFAAFFALMIVAQRWEFTISKDDKWEEAQNRERTASAMIAIANYVTDIITALKNLEGLASSATEGDVAAMERSTYDGHINSADASARKLAKGVEALSAKAAAEAVDVLEKARAAQRLAVSAANTRVDLLKKGTSGPDMYKKSSAAVKLAVEARKETETLATKVFGCY